MDDIGQTGKVKIYFIVFRKCVLLIILGVDNDIC